MKNGWKNLKVSAYLSHIAMSSGAQQHLKPLPSRPIISLTY